MRKRIVAVGFDLDGTLYNIMPIKIRNCGIVFQNFFKLGRLDFKDVYGRHGGIPRRDLYDGIAKDTIRRTLADAEYRVLSEDFDRLMDEQLTPDKFFPGALKLLQDLRDESRIVYMSSSVPQSTLEGTLRKLGAAALFSDILGSGGLVGAKGIEHSNYIRSKYIIPFPSQILYVGDERHDMSSARTAGIIPIGVTNSISAEELYDAGAQLVIGNITQVSGVIKGMESR